MSNIWHRKEKPFTGFAGFGGGVAGLANAGGSSGIETIMYLWGAGGGDRSGGAEPGNGGSGGFIQVSGGFAESDTLYVYVGNCGLSPYNNGSSMTPGILVEHQVAQEDLILVLVVAHVMSPLMVKELMGLEVQM